MNHGLLGEDSRMKQSELEQEALRLSPDERADLATKLLLSLEAGLDADVADDWMREARHRADEIDEGRARLVPADEVKARVRDLIG